MPVAAVEAVAAFQVLEAMEAACLPAATIDEVAEGLVANSTEGGAVVRQPPGPPRHLFPVELPSWVILRLGTDTYLCV